MPLGKKAFENIVRKGEIAGTSNFSFSHNVFYSIKDRNYHFCYIYFVVCKCFQFGQVQNFVVWERVKTSPAIYEGKVAIQVENCIFCSYNKVLFYGQIFLKFVLFPYIIDTFLCIFDAFDIFEICILNS